MQSKDIILQSKQTLNFELIS